MSFHNDPSLPDSFHIEGTLIKHNKTLLSDLIEIKQQRNYNENDHGSFSLSLRRSSLQEQLVEAAKFETQLLLTETVRNKTSTDLQRNIIILHIFNE